MLNLIAQQALKEGKLDVAEEANRVRGSVEQTLHQLGMQSDRYGIERWGAEVHIELDPALR